MAKELKRVKLESDTDLLGILEDVHTDKGPRVIERNGERLAILLDPDDYAPSALVPKSKRFKKDLLALAGAWRDVDADGLIEHIYQARRLIPTQCAAEGEA